MSYECPLCKWKVEKEAEKEPVSRKNQPPREKWDGGNVVTDPGQVEVDSLTGETLREVMEMLFPGKQKVAFLPGEAPKEELEAFFLLIKERLYPKELENGVPEKIRMEPVSS